MRYERRRNAEQLFYGVPEDIENWMSLVTRVRWNFPGLETQEKLDDHKATVLRFMGKRQAICVKEGNEIAGVMLFSRGYNMICCLAVSPDYRRRGVASMLMDEALRNLDITKEISVSTFRADDEKGPAPRALYEKYGFVEDALIEEMDYPNQKYVLHPAGSERKDRQITINKMVREIRSILQGRGSPDKKGKQKRKYVRSATICSGELLQERNRKIQRKSERAYLGIF